MYKIISISNKPHTVVYVCNHLSLPMFNSFDYNECQFYIDMKEQGKELYDECGFNYRDKSPYYDNKS